MQHQPPFDLYAGLFSVAEVAEVTGVPRPIIDVWVNRDVLSPTRRQRPPARRPQPDSKRAAARVGRPLFSCRDIFKVYLVRRLADFDLGSTESSGLAVVVAKATLSDTTAEEKFAESIAIAELLSFGEWMWACATSIERGEPFDLYGYAARLKGKWLFDMHFGARGAEPCFGWDCLNIFIPMFEFFEHVYVRCRKIVSVGDGEG